MAAAKLLLGDARREPEASALGALGVAAISTATTLATAAFEPPPGGFGTTTYNHLAVAGLAGTFLGGVALVGTSVWVSDNPAARRGTGKKLLYAAVPPLLAAVVLSVAALLCPCGARDSARPRISGRHRRGSSSPASPSPREPAPPVLGQDLVGDRLWGMLSCKKTRCNCSDFRGMYNLSKSSKRNAS
uniref:Uncharacterized protein n=1 Tax=Oryza barthii TaxID=65489 RepID=A0A0D3EJI3_9ORYZ